GILAPPPPPTHTRGRGFACEARVDLITTGDSPILSAWRGRRLRRPYLRRTCLPFFAAFWLR
ncbi:MAG: hypothetical protein LBK99_00045, partial [Opitutaceae bacterium]|nr:hypothetical protein [Opitutaceae bacterium]